MPLHLLPKKSWNVYSPANIARVRADEAEAAALEEGHDERLREHEAAARLALLRGERAPTPPPVEVVPVLSSKRGGDQDQDHARRGDVGGGRKRKRRSGEDDTEREIRYAREDEEARLAKRERGSKHEARGAVMGEEPPLMDHRGHIQLFAGPSTKQIRVERNADVEREKREKNERDGEEGQGMRFRDAAGYGRKSGEGPWYANSRPVDGRGAIGSGDEEAVVGRNAFGREDPNRGMRDRVRIDKADPMAAMARAQVQLKQATRRKEEVDRERLRELLALKEEQDRQERRASRRRARGEDELEGFSLDAPSHDDRREHRHRSHRRRRSHEKLPDDGRDRHRHEHRYRHRDHTLRPIFQS